MHADRRKWIGMMQRLSAAGDGQRWAAQVTGEGACAEVVCWYFSHPGNGEKG